MNDSKRPVARGSRRALIELLKRGGPQDAQRLARALGLTAMAVRQHLYELEAQGFAAHHEEPRPVGRPAKLWRLTAGADAFFPDGHAELSLDLLSAMRQAFGESGLDRLLAVRAEAQRKAYAKAIAGLPTLEARLQALAEVRGGEGYMAEVVRDADPGLLLVENHCPICAAAAACQGLCRSELEVFRAVLGPQVAVERVEHIPAGARRCAYRVRPF
jgi:predicted ArsR family transcriptional regulator